MVFFWNEKDVYLKGIKNSSRNSLICGGKKKILLVQCGIRQNNHPVFVLRILSICEHLLRIRRKKTRFALVLLASFAVVAQLVRAPACRRCSFLYESQIETLWDNGEG